MDTELVMYLLVIVAIILVAAGVCYYFRQRTSARLKEHFGPEYDQTVRKLHSQQRAEAELKDREKRVSTYKIVSLRPAERTGYRNTWMAVQGRFVDQPEKAVADADSLVQEVMQKCGYPLANFEQSASDLSVDHPHVVENYRAACRIAERSRRGDADTEQLRQALVYYRALFEDLLEDEEPEVRQGERSSSWTKSGKARAYPN